MTAAQREALDGLAQGARPRIAASTARVLSERYGYITPNGDGWELTPRGWAYLAKIRAQQQLSAVEAKLTPENRHWADRVEAWLKATERLNGWKGYGLWRIVRHIAACQHAGIDPAPEKMTADAQARLLSEIESASIILRHFDEEYELARRRGVGLTVDFQADGRVPRSRKDAAEAAATGAVIDLRTYRERRPDRQGA